MTEHSNRTGGCDSKTEGRDKWLYTAPVGQFPPNAFGLHDMHGNVWEWVEDTWRDNYSGTPPKDGSAWTEGGDASRRVVRGGSWFYSPDNLRSANRDKLSTGYRSSHLGFRVARALITP
jgi:formylglycine-generating enzyme required for sulfatase activity